MTMGQFQIKKIAKGFRKGQVAVNKEKVPLSSEKNTKNNGSIEKKPKKGSKKDFNNKKEELQSILNKEIKKEPMTIWRKLCFVLSLNAPILYVLFFTFFITCKDPLCSESSEWDIALGNKELTTNLEATGYDLVVFGVSNKSQELSQGEIYAVASSTGTVLWKRIINFIPSTCHCVLTDFDVNGDEIIDCLFIGRDGILAVNISDGYIFWQQTGFPFILNSKSSTSLEYCYDEAPRFVAPVISTETKKVSFNIFNSQNGELQLSVPLPCDAVPQKLVKWSAVYGYADQLAFDCTLKGITGIWTVEMDSLCSTDSSQKDVVSSKLKHLFSVGKINPLLTPISLVALSPSSGLVLGWYDNIAMVTTDGRDSWKISFNGSRVTSLRLGRFSSPKGNELAACIRNEDTETMEVHVFDLHTRQQIDSAFLGEGQLLSLRLISEPAKRVESLLVEKVAKRTLSDWSDLAKIPSELFTVYSNISYQIVNFASEKKVQEFVTAASVYSSAISSAPEKKHILILAKNTRNKTLSLNSYDLQVEDMC